MIIGQLFLISAVGKVISVWSPIRINQPDDVPPDARILLDDRPNVPAWPVRASLPVAVGQCLPEGRELGPDVRELLGHRGVRRSPIARAMSGSG